MHITGDGMLMTSGISGPGSDADLHMSPIGLEPVEGLGMMGMLDQGGLPWDLDGMYWGGQQAGSEAAAYGLHGGAQGGPHEMHAIDYGGMMSQAQAHAAVGMEGFPFVH